MDDGNTVSAFCHQKGKTLRIYFEINKEQFRPQSRLLVGHRMYYMLLGSKCKLAWQSLLDLMLLRLEDIVKICSDKATDLSFVNCLYHQKDPDRAKGI